MINRLLIWFRTIDLGYVTPETLAYWLLRDMRREWNA